MITPAWKKKGVYWFTSVHPFGRPSVILSVPPTVTSIFCHSFLSNHASQPLNTWYVVLARVPTCRLPNTGLPLICFLFNDLVYFRTFRTLPLFSLALFSATTHHSHLKHGMVLRLGVLHVAHQIQVCDLFTSCFTTCLFSDITW